MADSKLSDLPATTSPATTDILYIVTDPAGTPADKKVTVGDLRGASGGGLLAVKSYGQVTNYTTSSSTSADVDATNLVLPAFTVPASGQVLVRFEAVVNLSSDAANYGLWAVREGAADVVAKRVTAQGVANTVVRSFLITGLTPGASKTYKWGWSALGGLSFTMFTDPSSFGAAVMEAWAA